MPAPWQLRRGERRNYKRLLFEELLCLDARWLARKKLIPKDWSTRRYDFSFVIPPIAALTLTNRTAKILMRDGREQTVAIHWQHNGGIGYGSIRPMLVCQCGYGAFRLFDCFGAFRCYRCAIAFGVRYASQQVSRKGRKYLQSQRLRPLLGRISKPQHNSQTIVHAPQDLWCLALEIAPDRNQFRTPQVQGQAAYRVHAKAYQHVSGRSRPHRRCLGRVARSGDLPPPSPPSREGHRSPRQRCVFRRGGAQRGGTSSAQYLVDHIFVYRRRD